MRRSALLAAFVLAATSLLVSCGSGPPDAPSSSAQTPLVGQRFTLSGDIGDQNVRPVELQSYDKTWKKFAAGKTKASGKYSFTLTNKAGPKKFRVVAPAASGSETLTSDPVTITTAEDNISLGVYRLGKTGKASGKASPTITGRRFTLQHKQGAKWVPMGSGIKETSDGTVTATFDLSGTTTYRLVADGIDGSPGTTSPIETFSAGPAKLSDNVMYVTTDTRKNPVVKGKALKGKVLIVSGDEATRPIDLEEIADRGNSSADKVKKPYKLKFDHPQSPFRFPKDKTWILLANYGDHTLVRSKIGWDIATELDGVKWTPENVFTELYLNGKYQGSYQLVQSIKIDKHRVDVDEKTGVIIEIDPHFKEDGVPGFFGDHKIPYAFKDPDERKKKDDGTESLKGITDAKVAGMKERILDFEKVLYGPNFKDPVKGWTNYLDMDSAVDYYLAKEFTKENDGDFYRSNFFSVNDYADPKSKFLMGPLWDFDRSAGAKPPGGSTSIASPKGWWLRGNGSQNHKTDKTHWYVQLSKDPAFLGAVKARWAEKRAAFKDIANHGAERAAASLGPASASDRAMWGRFGDRYEAYSDTYAGEIAYLKDWYQKRFAWIDGQLK